MAMSGDGELQFNRSRVVNSCEIHVDSDNMCNTLVKNVRTSSHWLNGKRARISGDKSGLCRTLFSKFSETCSERSFIVLVIGYKFSFM